MISQVRMPSSSVSSLMLFFNVYHSPYHTVSLTYIYLVLWTVVISSARALQVIQAEVQLVPLRAVTTTRYINETRRNVSKSYMESLQ